MKSSINSTLSLLLLGLIATVPCVRGQDAPPPAAPDASGDQPPPPPHRHMRGPSAEELKAKLSLTDAQFTQVSGILASVKEQMKAVREDDSLSDDDRRDKMMDLMKSSHAQIRALLTPDQQKIFDAMKPPHGAPPPPPPPSN